MNDPHEQPKKIVIDEDWKTQVEREKQTLESVGQEPTSDTPTDSPEETTTQSTGELPPASYELLLTSLATQTMVYLGQIPDPIEQKAVVRLDLARHNIDMLTMLKEKTQGNLTDAENEATEAVVHQLRMAFVAISNQAS